MLTDTKKKNHISFFPAMALFAVICYLRHIKMELTAYTTTVFALNYEYGLIPKGFLGAVFKFINENTSLSTFDYLGVYSFSEFFTFVYYVMIFVFFFVCLKVCTKENARNAKHLMLFLAVFAFTMYATRVNFGSLDMYLYILLLISVSLLIIGKFEWLILPISIICMLIQHTFLYTHANIIVVLLLYKLLTGEKKQWMKYGSILLLFLVSVFGLHYYFENILVFDGKTIFQDIRPIAKSLSETGKSYSQVLLKGDIRGDDMTEYNLEHRIDNEQDLPVFLVLFSPYIIFGIRFFMKLVLKKALPLKSRILYLCMFLGAATMIPLFQTDIYYGRYVFNVVFYYVSILIATLCMGDRGVANELDSLKSDLKFLTPMTFIWFLYPFLLTPFRSVAISTAIHYFAEVYFTELSFFIIP